MRFNARAQNKMIKMKIIVIIYHINMKTLLK